MTTSWKVSYHLTTPVDVSNTVTEYPDLHVSFIYDACNKLVRVDHRLSIEGNPTADSTVMLSQATLKLFWELMHFRRGVSLQVNKHSVESLHPDDSKEVSCTNLIIAQAKASICRSVLMPQPKVFANPGHRMVVWLRLANEARDTPFFADAIRNYYMIWEDIHGRPTNTNAPKEALELKFVRDFVSQGGKLSNLDVLSFLEALFGRGTKQYDPTDHKNLVDHFRMIGRTLIESELERLMTEN